MAFYTRKVIKNGQGFVFIEQNITAHDEILSFQKDEAYGEVWLMKYKEMSEGKWWTFYSLQRERKHDPSFTKHYIKVKQLGEGFFNLKTAKGRQNFLYKAIEKDQKKSHPKPMATKERKRKVKVSPSTPSKAIKR